MPPKSRIWRAAMLVARVVGKARVEDACSTGGCSARSAATARAFSQWRSMRTASVFRPRRTSQQSNGPGTAPSDFWRNLSRSATRRVVRRGEAADHVRVAAEVLRRRVDDDVGAELERPLEVGRGERVVDDHQRARRRAPPPRPSRCRSTFSSGFVGVSTQTMRVRSSRCSSRPAVDLLGGDEREAVALRLVDLGEQPVGAAVDVVHADDVVAGLEQVHDRRRRAEPGRVGKPVLGAFQRGEAGLERRPRRVPGARVVVALVHSDVVLGVRRRLVDRRDHRPGRRVGLLPVVDRARLEVHGRSLRSPSSPNTDECRHWDMVGTG